MVRAMEIAATGQLDGQHRVVTPEYVEFDFVLAGLFSRFLAWLIDSLIVVVITVGAGLVMGLLSLVLQEFGAALFFVLYFLVDHGYGIALETWWSGQTIGKRALGLRVIQESGVRIGFFQAAVRNLARLVDRLPVLYLVGGVSALFSQSQQRLGDMLAGTIVVRERRLKLPANITCPEGERQLLEDPLFQSRIAKLSADERQVLYAAAIRREELSMDARLKLFASLSQRLQDERDVYKPPNLSDEKLVLLVAAALADREKASRERTLRNL